MKKEMYAGSVSPDRDRMLKYKAYAAAFSYPGNGFFEIFPHLISRKETLISQYDNLFRANEIWLYTAEYTAENEFERAKIMADIMGFYKAFKVEPSKDRPDSLTAELEFMHYLIFKRLHALERKIRDAKEKASVCFDAERKFFKEHLYPGAKKITEKISSQARGGFYYEAARELYDFLKSEKRYLKEN